MQSDALKDLLEQATISEVHCTQMGTVIERISSTESGLQEAFMSLLKGFELREIVYVFYSTAYVRCAFIQIVSLRLSLSSKTAANIGS